MILANKKVGETPLELIKRLYPNQSPITYAGRLDPMAEGLMIFLVGKDVHDKDKYLKLDKTYELDILLGISTDTYDTLGIIQKTNLSKSTPLPLIKNTLKNYPRKYSQTYPPYSSKPVNGHPLWWWSKNNRLAEITLPTKEVQIKSLKLTKISENNLPKLVKTIITNLNQVTGDFRQKEIIAFWEKLATAHPNKKLQVVSLTVSCTSGTYMRSIANRIGEILNLPALALRIKRIKIGKYTI